MLCVAPNWLGDAVLARGAVAALGRAGVRVDVWARGRAGRAFADLPAVGRVLVQPARRASRFRAAWSLRRAGYAAVVVLPPSWSSAFAAWLVHAPVRVGFAAAGRSRWLTHSLPARPRTVHLQTQYEELAAAVLHASGRAADPVPQTPPLLRADAGERDAGQAILQAAGVRRRYAVLAPGARFGPAKKWPCERFAAVAAHLRTAYGWDVVLAGERGDAPETAAVRALEPAAIDLAGTTSLAALVGVLAAAEVVVANDSGTMHLAAALGRPVVGIFGSTSPAWTAPVGPAVRFLSDPPWCAPCFAKTCVQDFACMLRITPEHIATELVALQLPRPPSPERA